MAAERSCDAAEAELNAFIERRAKAEEAQAAERLREAMYAASCRRFAEEEAKALRAQWRQYERHLAAVHQSLADQHRQRARQFDNHNE